MRMLLAILPILASFPAAGQDLIQVGYAPGEFERIMASDPGPEQLIRLMLVGEDINRVEALIEIIVDPAEMEWDVPLVVAMRSEQ